MNGQESNMRELIAIVALGLYGIYLIVTGVLIVWKKRQILDLVNLIQIYFMNIGGNSEKAVEYEKNLKMAKNWPQHGVFVMAIGVAIIVISTLMANLIFYK
jgi:hypothetical protein